MAGSGLPRLGSANRFTLGIAPPEDGLGMAWNGSPRLGRTELLRVGNANRLTLGEAHCNFRLHLLMRGSMGNC